MVLGIGIDLPPARWSRCDDCPSASKCRMAGQGLARHVMTDRTAPFTLGFPQIDREIASHDGETIFQSARRSGVRIIGACGGRGTCGTCRVLIRDGEIDGADAKTLPNGKPRWVRACQVTPQSDCAIEIAERSLAPIVRAEFDAGETVEILALDPAVVSQDVSVAEANARR